MRRPLLQVALDVTEVSRALEIARSICSELGDHVLVEAGTPLIKKAGISVVSELASVCRCAGVVADMKTVDAAEVEVSMALNAGADYVTVLAIAGESTLTRAISTARRLGGKVIVDLIHVENPQDRVGSLVALGPDAVCFHVGIDAQRERGVTVNEMLNEIRETKAKYKGLLVSAAGGVTPSVASKLVAAGVDIVVVGGYITKSGDLSPQRSKS